MTTDVQKTDLVTLTIDDVEVSVPKGTLVIRAAEQAGIAIPRFCDHPLLAPVGACRQCLVEVAMPDREGNLKTMMGPPGRVKPQASCTLVVSDGMVVNTQITSKIADKAQQGNMEFLLINHPLDCPVCDKGGECPLQNQAMTNGRGESRYTESKRTYPKPISISAQVLLDRERCVLCARCTRFSEQIAGDPFIALVERGALQQVGIYEREPFESYFSGNTIQICPVGALTSTSYRFRSRPFDLVSTPSVAEHDSGGAAIRVDHRRGRVMRRLSGVDPEVNEEWITDKDRFAFGYTVLEDRLRHPLVRDEELGGLRAASWPEALTVAARGLRAAAEAGGVGVLTGGRLTLEDSYAYAKFARVALGTNDVDFRARPHTEEEERFLASAVAGSGLGVTYTDVEHASVVVLVALEPEDEAGNLFLRLRKGVQAGGTRVYAVAPFTSRGLQKTDGVLLRAAPGEEVPVLSALADDGEVALDAGGVILVGERAATTPGLLEAVMSLAGTTGARVAWVPRRAGDRGAVEAGCLPTLLPGGRPVADAAARVDVGTVWGRTAPAHPGRDGNAIVAAAAAGELGGLLIAGVDPVDLPDPAAARLAIERAGFVVSLELRGSEVTDHADVVLPVAAPVEKSGTFVNWEGRLRPFGKVLRDSLAMPDVRVLAGIADELGIDLGFRTTEQAAAELAELGRWDGERVPAPTGPTGPSDGLEASPSGSLGDASSLGSSGQAAPRPADGLELRLATWKQLLGDGRMLAGDDHLLATARPPLALVSAGTLTRLGVAVGERVTLRGPNGTGTTLPVAVADLPDGVVWTPTTSATAGWAAEAGSAVRLEIPEGARP
jgi:NADH-quinone oxidoreductase subunit G